MFRSVEQRNGQTGDRVFNKKTTMMIILSHSVYECVGERERESERERFPSSCWQQLLIKSGPMKQDSRQEPISAWIMPYLSFSSFSLHSTSALDSLHLSRQILDVRGRKKKTLAHIGLPSGSVQIFFFFFFQSRQL